MAQTGTSLPSHLARFVAPQDYGAYTPRDQAVWRHILSRLVMRLEGRAHPSYLRGLAATGIRLDRIPSLEEMNGCLERLGWRAVGVRGFIPPAVFTELQSMGVLAIASDIRSHQHIDYTPAPDIVHESAGHAPILADPLYSEYVKRCGVAGFKAIASREDQAVYEAIRNLSVVKEDPGRTPLDELEAERALRIAQAGRSRVSESARASRLYWWTAEYGLVGPPEAPRIYGAGILSSLGEADHCLGPSVRRLPLSLACVDQDFDITSMQPQLFVARDFDHLFQVLEAFEATLSWKVGGRPGLEEALRAGTVNHLVLDSGLEITGRVAGLEGNLARVEGPVMLSRKGKAQGGLRRGPVLVVLGTREPSGPGGFRLDLDGVGLEGRLGEGNAVEELRGTFQGRPLEASPGTLLFAAGGLPSVAGGPGDPEAWDRIFGREPGPGGDREREARRRKGEALPPGLAALYQEARSLRNEGRPDPDRLGALRRALEAYPEDWLLAEEVEELLHLPASPRTVEGTLHLERP